MAPQVLQIAGVISEVYYYCMHAPHLDGKTAVEEMYKVVKYNSIHNCLEIADKER